MFAARAASRAVTSLALRLSRISSSVSTALQLNTRGGKIRMAAGLTGLTTVSIFYPRRVPEDVVYRSSMYGISGVYDGEIVARDMTLLQLTSKILRYTVATRLLNITMPIHKVLQLCRLHRPFDVLLEHIVTPLYSGGTSALEVGKLVNTMSDRFINIAIHYIIPWTTASSFGYPLDYLPYEENLDIETERTLALLDISDETPQISAVFVTLSALFPPPLLRRIDSVLSVQQHVLQINNTVANSSSAISSAAYNSVASALTEEETVMFSKGLERLIRVCETARTVGTPVIISTEHNAALSGTVRWMWSQLAAVYNKNSPVVFLQQPVDQLGISTTGVIHNPEAKPEDPVNFEISTVLENMISHARDHDYVLALVLSTRGHSITSPLEQLSRADVSTAVVVHTHSLENVLELVAFRSPARQYKISPVLMCDHGVAPHLLEAVANEGVPCILHVPYGPRDAVMTWLMEKHKQHSRSSASPTILRVLVLEWWRRLGVSWY